MSPTRKLDAAESPQAAYRPDIDGLRAVAILSVLAFHANPQVLPGGFAGVDIFFVISGYLITGIILRQLGRGRFDFIDFYSRRIRRLFPALIVVFSAVGLAGWILLLSDEFRRLGKQMAAGAIFSLNLSLFQNTDAYFLLDRQPLIHLWSLGVEEQFYLFWPLFLVATWAFMKRYFVAVLALLTAASFVINVAEIPWNPLASFYLPWCRLWELSLGGILAYYFCSERSRPIPSPALAATATRTRRHRANIVGIAGMMLLVLTFSELRSTWTHPGFQGVLPACGTALLIAAGPTSWINRHVLTRKAIVFIGLISYPLYLWHWPLLSFAHIVTGDRLRGWTAAAGVSAAFALAFLTYRYAELPVRNGRPKARTTLALLGAVFAFGVVGHLALLQKIPARTQSLQVARFERASENWVTGLPDTSWTNLTSDFIEIGAGERQVLYIGDSFMQQYFLRVNQLVRDHPLNRHRAVFAVRAACVPLLEELESPFGRQACIEHGRRALRYANRPTVDAIVIGSVWVGSFSSFDGEKYVLARDADRIVAPLKTAIAGLIAKGKVVYIVLASPLHRALNPRLMIQRRVAVSPFEVVIPPPPSRRVIERTLLSVNEKLMQVAAETGAKVIAPIASLCSRELCPSVTPEGEPIYVDDGHLRPSYAMTHVRYLDETIVHPADLTHR